MASPQKLLKDGISIARSLSLYGRHLGTRHVATSSVLNTFQQVTIFLEPRMPKNIAILEMRSYDCHIQFLHDLQLNIYKGSFIRPGNWFALLTAFLPVLRTSSYCPICQLCMPKSLKYCFTQFCHNIRLWPHIV